ncbi:hypothetical protein [Candidatus Walczuchella endosymbiont of Icerya purchasi]
MDGSSLPFLKAIEQAGIITVYDINGTKPMAQAVGSRREDY